MTDFPALFVRLVDDAAMFPPGNASAGDAVRRHLEHRQAWYAPMIGPLVVSDQVLRQAQDAFRQAQGGFGQDAIDVSVINTGGAGGLLSLAGRDLPGLRVVSVESALRDLDDLAGNAARVVSAATELDESVQVFVEFPYAAGWERAVEEVEAGGLLGKIRTGGLDPADTPSAAQLAGQLSVLIEADLPFKATAGLHHAWPTTGPSPDRPRQHGFLTLLGAIEALIEGAAADEAAEMLGGGDQDALLQRQRGWDEAQAARVRRRLHSFGCCGVTDPVTDLVQLGLLAEPA